MYCMYVSLARAYAVQPDCQSTCQRSRPCQQRATRCTVPYILARRDAHSVFILIMLHQKIQWAATMSSWISTRDDYFFSPKRTRDAISAAVLFPSWLPKNKFSRPNSLGRNQGRNTTCTTAFPTVLRLPFSERNVLGPHGRS
jgi:hypothetical protein